MRWWEQSLSVEYAAGLFDADGCVDVESTGGLRVRIYGGDRSTFQRLSERFCGSVVPRHSPGEVQRILHRDGRPVVSRRWCWCWVVYGKNALQFLDAVYPFVREKRAQVRAVLRARSRKRSYSSIRTALSRLKKPMKFAEMGKVAIGGPRTPAPLPELEPRGCDVETCQV